MSNTEEGKKKLAEMAERLRLKKLEKERLSKLTLE